MRSENYSYNLKCAHGPVKTLITGSLLLFPCLLPFFLCLLAFQGLGIVTGISWSKFYSFKVFGQKALDCADHYRDCADHTVP